MHILRSNKCFEFRRDNEIIRSISENTGVRPVIVRGQVLYA